MTLLQDEVLRSLIGEELGAMAEDEVVQLQHDALRSGVVLLRMLGKAETVKLGEFLQPIKSPLQRAHDAIGVEGGQPGFPAVHPARVQFPQGSLHLAVWAWIRNCSTTADISSSPWPAAMACSNTRKAARPISRSRAWWSASLTA